MPGLDGAWDVPAELCMKSSVGLGWRSISRTSLATARESHSLSPPLLSSHSLKSQPNNLQLTMIKGGTPRTCRSKHGNSSAFRHLGVLSSSGGGFIKAADMNAKTKHTKAAANINKQKLVVGYSGLGDTEMKILVSSTNYFSLVL